MLSAATRAAGGVARSIVAAVVGAGARAPHRARSFETHSLILMHGDWLIHMLIYWHCGVLACSRHGDRRRGRPPDGLRQRGRPAAGRAGRGGHRRAHLRGARRLPPQDMDLRRLLHGRAHQAHAAGAPELRGRPAPARLRVPGHKRRAGRADGGAAVPAAQLHRCPRRSLRAELPGDGRAEGRRREPPGDDAHQGNRGRRAADHLPHLPPGVPRRRERQEAAGLRPRVPPGVHRRLAPVEAPVPDVPPRRLLASYRPAGDGACVARRRRGPSR